MESKAWEMSCKGKSLRTIGAALGVSHVYASRLIDRVAMRLSIGQEQHKWRRHGQLEQIIEDLYTQWEKSCEPRTRVTERIEGDETIKTTDVIEQGGNVSLLSQLMAAMDRIFRLHGLGVADATQEISDSVAALRQDIVNRAKRHIEAQISGPVDPGGGQGSADVGGSGVRDLSSEVQRNDPLP
jgi:hypothetical protein